MLFRSPPPSLPFSTADPFDHSASQSPFDPLSPFPTDPFSLSLATTASPIPELSVAEFLGREHKVLEQYGDAFVEAGCSDSASLLRLPEGEMRAFIDEDLVRSLSVCG